MNNLNNIRVFEHDRLTTAHPKFKTKHLNALLKLNEYHDFAYFEAIPNGIKFNQYVGIIQIETLSIEILPKADKNSDDENWQGVLLQMLQACGRIKASSAGTAYVKRQNLNLLEVYFELFINEVNGLIKKGLIKKYRKETSNVKALKGKLEFAGNIQKNLVHKECFYTTHQIYDKNHILHQILNVALQIVSQFSKGTYLNDVCKRVILNFPEVTKKTITKSLLDSVKLNRKTGSYSYALELARLIILNYSPDISSGKEKMISLLFNMNNLWEEYVLTKLRITLENTNYEVYGQESKSFISGNSLKPDIIIKNKKTQEIYIIDTKWKLSKNAANVSDLRQMYTYSRFWNANKGMLLYPGNHQNNKFNNFKTDDCSLINNEHIEMNHQCKLGYVSVLDDNQLNENIGNEILKLMEITTINLA